MENPLYKEPGAHEGEVTAVQDYSIVGPTAAAAVVGLGISLESSAVVAVNQVSGKYL